MLLRRWSDGDPGAVGEITALVYDVDSCPHHDAMIIMMRTTVNLPEDVLAAARALAQLRGQSLGDALGELVRRGLKASLAIDTQKPFPCFVLPSGATPITLEQTLQAEDEL